MISVTLYTAYVGKFATRDTRKHVYTLELNHYSFFFCQTVHFLLLLLPAFFFFKRILKTGRVSKTLLAKSLQSWRDKLLIKVLLSPFLDRCFVMCGLAKKIPKVNKETWAKFPHRPLFILLASVARSFWVLAGRTAWRGVAFTAVMKRGCWWGRALWECVFGVSW